MKFEKIVKKWAHAIDLFKKDAPLEYLKYLYENELDIALANRCVVGEAHHWKTFYTYNRGGELCNECDQISFEFMHSFRGNRPVMSKFERVKEKFEKHWCEIHSEAPSAKVKGKK